MAIPSASAVTEFISPEMFKDYDGDDWTIALNNMFKTCIDMPTGSGITESTLYEKASLTSNSKIVVLTKLYRYTEPLHIPPNVTVWQTVQTGFFSKISSCLGLYYDPPAENMNTYAVAPFFYKRDLDGTYHLDTDVMTNPNEADVLAGNYYQTGQRITLENLSIITKSQVTLGFRAVGFAGSVANNLNVGTQDGDYSHSPKVGVLVNSSWGTTFNKPTVTYSVQGWVNTGSNGGLVANYAYINAVDTDVPMMDISPVFPIDGFTEKGAIGITNSSDCYWNNPITEHARFPYVSNAYLRVLHPHIEGGDTRNIFYFIGSNAGGYAEAEITLKDILHLGVEELETSVVYVKGGTAADSIVINGRVTTNARLVNGENSTACVTLDISRSQYQIQVGGWGDINLLRSINNTWGDKTIFVDPVNGNDTAMGLRNSNALKSLTHVKKLCELMGIAQVSILNDLTYTANVLLPSNIEFVGRKISGSGESKLLASGKIDIRFNNTINEHLTNKSLLYLTGYTIGSVLFNSQLITSGCAVSTEDATDITITYTGRQSKVQSLVGSYKFGREHVSSMKTVVAITGGSEVVKYTSALL